MFVVGQYKTTSDYFGKSVSINGAGDTDVDTAQTAILAGVWRSVATVSVVW
jgi:hypothetical protein